MCLLRFENNLLTIEGVRFASISKKTPLSKLSFAFVSLALPLLIPTNTVHTVLYDFMHFRSQIFAHMLLGSADECNTCASNSLSEDVL
jgi:hypothetical protein